MKGPSLMIRLLCVEDDPIVRRYLVTRLAAEPDMRVVGAAPDISRGLIYLARDEIDIVLLDYILPGRDGISLAEAMAPWLIWPHPDEPRPMVLFCTGQAADEDFRAKARLVGARGVVSKDRLRSDLIPAVREVARGGSWWFRHELQGMV